MIQTPAVRLPGIRPSEPANVLYSREVQQPARTTPAMCDCGQAEQPGKAAAVLGRAHVLHLGALRPLTRDRLWNVHRLAEVDAHSPH